MSITKTFKYWWLAGILSHIQLDPGSTKTVEDLFLSLAIVLEAWLI